MRTLGILLVLAALAGCATPEPAPAGPADPTPASPTAVTPAPTGTDEPPTRGPAWSFTATDGRTYSRDSPKGEATAIFFMATWCSSCRSVAPTIAQISDEYEMRGVRFYSLDFDPTETHEDLRRWQEQYQQDWPHGIDSDRSIQRTFNVRSQSTVLVLDGEGEVVRLFTYGRVTESGLREALDEALAA